MTYSQFTGNRTSSKEQIKRNKSVFLAKALLKVVLPFRKQMLEITNSFQANFLVNCQQESIPFPLLSLCSLLIYGANATPTNFSQAALSVSQLIKRVQTNETSLANWRDLKKRETPLPLYVGLKLLTMRAKTIIQTKTFPSRHLHIICQMSWYME